MNVLKRPSKTYQAGTIVVDVPPASLRKFTGAEVICTRENWPGESTLAVNITPATTTLTVPAGDGAKFPVSGGKLALSSVGDSEIVLLTSTVGDVLTVTRSATPVAFLAGAKVLLLDLVTVRTERTVDGGTTWEVVDGATFPGGVFRIRGQEILESRTGVRFTDANGLPLEKNGDIRVTLINKMSYRTALTVEMRELGDV